MKENLLKSSERSRFKQQAKLLKFLSEYTKEIYPDVYNVQIKAAAGSRADINLGRLCNSIQRLSQEAGNIAECLADIATDSPRLL